MMLSCLKVNPIFWNSKWYGDEMITQDELIVIKRDRTSIYSFSHFIDHCSEIFYRTPIKSSIYETWNAILNHELLPFNATLTDDHIIFETAEDKFEFQIYWG